MVHEIRVTVRVSAVRQSRVTLQLQNLHFQVDQEGRPIRPRGADWESSRFPAPARRRVSLALHRALAPAAHHAADFVQPFRWKA
jgi:hypothetical protein